MTVVRFPIEFTDTIVARVHGIALNIVPYSHLYGVEIQRAPDVAGSPGSYETLVITSARSTTTQGFVYVDEVPNSADGYWYRIRHVRDGYEDSDWVGPVRGYPIEIPMHFIANAEDARIDWVSGSIQTAKQEAIVSASVEAVASASQEITDRGLDEDGDFTGTIGGVESELIASTQQGVFLETFDVFNPTAYPGRWSLGSSVSNATIVTGSGQTGGSVLRATGYVSAYWQTNIPYDPTKLYRYRTRFRQVTQSSGSAARFYFGLNCVQADGVTNAPVSSGGNQNHYNNVSSLLVTGSTNWTEVTTYFRGWSTSGTGQSTDPSSPTPLYNLVRYIRPMFLANYYTTADGVAEIDYISIDIVDENSLPYVYNHLDESGLKSVIQGPNLPSTTPVTNGLYINSSYLGYWDTVNGWRSYIGADGNFQFLGNANNSINWNGTSLNIKGAITITGGNAATTSSVNTAAAQASSSAITHANTVAAQASSSAITYANTAAAAASSSAMSYADASDATLASAINRNYQIGAQILSNPDFARGSSGWATYGANVSHSFEWNNAAPNSSGRVLKITTSAASAPGHGGYVYSLVVDNGIATTDRYHRGNTMVFRIRANIPTGYTIYDASNATGTGASTAWLSARTGSGDWATYVFRRTIGTTGTFSSTGHFYIGGGAGVPVTWYVASEEVFDIDRPPVVYTYGGMRTSSGSVLIDADIITSQGTANDTSNVGGVAATTVSSSVALATTHLDQSNGLASAIRGPSLPALTPASNGLYMTSTYLGYYNTGSGWVSYINNGGQFQFQGNSTNKLIWNGAVLAMTGSLVATAGYISSSFAIGSPGKQIVFDGQDIVSGSTHRQPSIYIGTGTYNNSNTPFYVARKSDGGVLFSLGQALTFDSAGGVVGTLTLSSGSTFNGLTPFTIIKTGTATANQTVNFTSGNTFQNPPKIIFGTSEQTYDNRLSSVPHGVYAYAESITTGSFICRAYIKSLAATLTAVTASTGATGTYNGYPGAYKNVNNTGSINNGEYTFQYDLTLAAADATPARMLVGFYVDPTGGADVSDWVFLAQEAYTNFDTGGTLSYLNEQKQVTTSYTGSAARFYAVRLNDYGKAGQSLNLDHVAFDVSSGATQYNLTGSIQWMAIGD